MPEPTPGGDGVGDGEDGDEPPHLDAIVAMTTSPTPVRQNRRYGDTSRRLSYARENLFSHKTQLAPLASLGNLLTNEHRPLPREVLHHDD